MSPTAEGFREKRPTNRFVLVGFNLKTAVPSYSSSALKTAESWTLMTD